MKKILIINLLIFSVCLINGQTTIVSVAGTQIQTEKVFDNTTTAAVINLGTLSGVAAGDSVGLSVSANYEHANADSDINIIVRYALSGPDAALYELTDSIDTLANGIITRRQLYRDSVVLPTVKIYDGTTDCTIIYSGTPRNYVTHHILTTIDSLYFEDPNVGENKPVHIVFGMNGEDEANYIPPHDTTIYVSIIPKTLTVTGTQVKKTKTYDGTSNVEVTNPGTLQGVLYLDSVRFRIALAQFDDKMVGTEKSINIYYELYCPDSINYTINHIYFLDGEIKPIQLTAEGGTVECSKDYDSTTHAVVSMPATPVGVLPGEQVYLTTNAEFEDTEPGKGKKVYCWFTIYGRDMANYLAPEDSVVCTDGEIRGSVDDAVEQVEAHEGIFPNPACDRVYVEDEQVTIYNMTGAKVYAGNGGTIDVSGLPDGIYIVRGTDKKGEKLIICR